MDLHLFISQLTRHNVTLKEKKTGYGHFDVAKLLPVNYELSGKYGIFSFELLGEFDPQCNLTTLKETFTTLDSTDFAVRMHRAFNFEYLNPLRVSILLENLVDPPPPSHGIYFKISGKIVGAQRFNFMVCNLLSALKDGSALNTDYPTIGICQQP